MTTQDDRIDLYNFDKQSFEYREAPQTADEALSYLPDIDDARGLFGLYVETGEPIIDAMIKVLRAVIGEEATAQP